MCIVTLTTMPDHCNAFVPGEWAQIADESHLVSVLKRYRNGQEVFDRVRPKIGQRLRITGYSFPHGAGVLYELQGIDGPVWEECLVDWTIREDDEADTAAAKIYTIRAVEEGGETYVAIEDKRGRVFSKIWRACPESAVTEISEIAAMRGRGAFEARFGFDGDYTNKRRD